MGTSGRIIQIFTITILILLSISFVNVLAIQQNKSSKYNELNNVPQVTWDKLADMKIYFGHHSVGTNILEGVKDLLADNPNIHLKIIHQKKIGDRIIEPALVHGNVGQNMDPVSKINSFKNKIETGYGQDADIAFFKFCFVDFTPETNIGNIFRLYKSTIDSLIKEYPNTTFVIVTTPLTCYAPGPHGWVKRTKDLIKSVIGKLNVYDHRSANIFNEKLVEKYQGKVPIFDLAKFESTYPDGSRSFYKKDGVTYYELVQEYTTDGGHLNEGGKKIIAEKLLLFLANLINQDPQKQ